MVECGGVGSFQGEFREVSERVQGGRSAFGALSLCALSVILNEVKNLVISANLFALGRSFDYAALRSG